jgi:hypothetical protein
MSAISVQTPFPIFNDIDGQPLEGGYVFVGVANLDPQVNPVAVFFDEALTQPAGQPIRTIGGYAVNSGTPANLYTVSDYSIRVTNKNSSVIYSAPIAQNYLTFPEDLAAVGTGKGANLVGFMQSGTGAVAISSQDKLRQIVHVSDFGAVGNGVTDDTGSIQAAINFVQAQNSGQIELHLGAKTYRIVGTLLISGTVRIVGQGAFDLSNSRPITLPGKGTWFIHASTSGPLIQVTGNLTKGSGLFDIAIFQEGHATPASGWVPAIRDWTIRVEDTQGVFHLNRVHFHNVYRGVLTDFAFRTQYENITGQFFFRGFSFDRVFDLCKFDGLHAWTYWSEANSVLQYQQANAVTITLSRVDGMWLDRIFTFAVQASMFFTTGAFGSAKVIFVNGLYADFTARAIVVDSTQPAHVQVSNVFHLGQSWPPTTPANALAGAALLDISSGSNHLVQITNAYSVLAASHAIRVNGANNIVWLGSAILEQYSRGGAGNGAVTASSSNIISFGSQPLLSPYAGGVATIFNGTPGGTVFGQTHQITTTAAINTPITAGSSSGNLAVFTVEGETDAGVALLAKNNGIVNIGSASNRVGFYGSASVARQTGVAVSAEAIHLALVNLGLIT